MQNTIGRFMDVSIEVTVHINIQTSAAKVLFTSADFMSIYFFQGVGGIFWRGNNTLFFVEKSTFLWRIFFFDFCFSQASIFTNSICCFLTTFLYLFIYWASLFFFLLIFLPFLLNVYLHFIYLFFKETAHAFQLPSIFAACGPAQNTIFNHTTVINKGNISSSRGRNGLSPFPLLTMGIMTLFHQRFILRTASRSRFRS